MFNFAHFNFVFVFLLRFALLYISCEGVHASVNTRLEVVICSRYSSYICIHRDLFWFVEYLSVVRFLLLESSCDNIEY